MTDPTLSDDDRSHLVVAILLGLEVMARVVRGRDYVGVQVGTDAERIIWSGSSGTWRWTAVDRQSGEVRVGEGSVGRGASIDAIVEMILSSRIS